jgi:hypothetical protein
VACFFLKARARERMRDEGGYAPAQHQLDDGVHRCLLATEHHDLIGLHGARRARLRGCARRRFGHIPVTVFSTAPGKPCRAVSVAQADEGP